MRYQERYYRETLFGGFTNIDGTISFFTRVNALIKPTDTILDVGCGRGQYKDDPIIIRRNLQMLKGKASRVIGIDVDAAGQTNQYVDEFRLLDTKKSWPVEKQSIDLLVTDYVVEHVDDPDMFFSECHRVLKSNGYLCIRTTNKYSYVALASILIPNRHHATVLTQAQDRRKEEDVFPTRYRCNSRRKLQRVLERHGFDAAVCCYEAEPSYLSFSRFAYLLGVLHQRYAPQALKPALFAFGQKR